MPKNSDDYALVVGINDYPKYHSLQGAIEDALDFAKWLRDEPDGGGLEDVHEVLSQPNPIRPIQEDIDDAMDKIFAKIGDRQARRFYFYFSGHGLAHVRLGSNLCLASWSYLHRNAALDSEEYLNLLLESGKFKEVIMFLDCCRVRLVNARGLPSTLGFAKPAAQSGRARAFVGYASERQKEAFEAAPDNGLSIRRGHFTRALLGALHGGAANYNGGVTADDLKSYLEREVPRIAAKHSQEQAPDISNGLLANPEPVFGSAQATMIDVEINVRAGRKGPILLEGPDLKEVRKGDPPPRSWALKLPLGLYMLRDLDAGDQQPVRIVAQEGGLHVSF